MASVAGVRRLRKSRFQTTVREPDGHVGVSAFGRKAGRAISVCRGAPGAPHTSGWHPLRPQRYRRAVGPGRIEPQAVLPPIFLDAPELVGGSGAAGERIGVKNPPRAEFRDGGRRPNPDTIRTGSVTAPRFRARGTSFALLHGAGCPTLPDPANRPRRCTLLGEASRFASTVPENLRPSTRHRNLHRPTHTDINKTASQQNYTTAQRHNDTTTQQHNNKTAKQ